MSDYDNQIGLWKRIPKKDASGNSLDKPGVKYPEYTGKATINGEPKQAAAWLNVEKTKDTQPDISIKLSDPIAKEEQPF
nr:hypothetical protein [uncultured Mediterranean phage uvMED]